MTDFVGTSGNDNYVGTSGDDHFDMTQGGNDRVKAGDGFNQIDFGATLTAADRIIGGSGFDIVSIQGDYSEGVTLGADTLHGIERIQFLAGFNYRLTLVDGNVDPGSQLDLSNDHGARSIWVDASAMVNGGSVYTYSEERNTIIGSQSNDHFQEFTTQFILDGQGGDDLVEAFTGLDGKSRFDGGDGSDTLNLGESFTGTLKAAAIRHVELVNLTGNSHIAFANGNVGGRETMTVTAGDASFVDASAETSGHYSIVGSAGNDILIGGGGADNLEGGGSDDQLIGGRGADVLTGGEGVDTFSFELTSESTKKAHDLITDFGVGTDRLDLTEIDARTDKGGDQAFHLVAKFTHAAGELTLAYDAETDTTHVKGDVNGDGKADLWIDVAGHLTDATGFLL